MKIASIRKNLLTGIEIADEIKRTTSHDDMKIVRCILCDDDRNVPGIFRFLRIIPAKYNQVIRIGIWLELRK